MKILQPVTMALQQKDKERTQREALAVENCQPPGKMTPLPIRLHNKITNITIFFLKIPWVSHKSAITSSLFYLL